MLDPQREYELRLAEWSRQAEAQERAHVRMGNLRLLFLVTLVVLTAILAQTRIGVGVALTILMFGLVGTEMFHNRIIRSRDRARRAMRFYEAGLKRLDGTWVEDGRNLDGRRTYGIEFLDPLHPYASDLDLFGPGSVFELINTAQTQSGRAALATWLLEPAGSEEILARQQTIAELRPKLNLRERLGLIAAESEGWVHTEALIEWAVQPARLRSRLVRITALLLPLLTLVLYLAGERTACVAALAAQFGLARFWKSRVRQVVRETGFLPTDLERLADVLRCIEKEPFQSERLRRMEEEARSDGILPAEAIERLGNLYSWMVSANNLLFAIVCGFFLWETQFAFAIEAWRARFGPKVEVWLRRLAEFEALSSLASYAFEHPADSFPELLPPNALARIEAEGLAHPLIPEQRSVRNDLALGPECRLIVISGSNMSGKSTWLRAIGVNLVLASTGAPVRARKFQMTPVRIGASIRAIDSLHEGISRFYAEIKRLAEIVKMTKGGRTLVFLLDEVLSGTNSHDRRIGASAIALSLVKRGALGLMTTHDLALTAIVDEIQPHGLNCHFEDQLHDGKMTFDYRLRPGIVEKSNAIELMRSVGLEVEKES